MSYVGSRASSSAITWSLAPKSRRGRDASVDDGVPGMAGTGRAGGGASRLPHGEGVASGFTMRHYSDRRRVRGERDAAAGRCLRALPRAAAVGDRVKSVTD